VAIVFGAYLVLEKVVSRRERRGASIKKNLDVDRDVPKAGGNPTQSEAARMT
jgi:hypothetical protein